MTDDGVMAQPVRTFLEGAELKTPESEPYLMSRSHFLDLERAGLVVEARPVRQELEPAAETPAEPDQPKRRGRPPRAR